MRPAFGRCRVHRCAARCACCQRHPGTALAPRGARRSGEAGRRLMPCTPRRAPRRARRRGACGRARRDDLKRFPFCVSVQSVCVVGALRRLCRRSAGVARARCTAHQCRDRHSSAFRPRLVECHVLDPRMPRRRTVRRSDCSGTTVHTMWRARCVPRPPRRASNVARECAPRCSRRPFLPATLRRSASRGKGEIGSRGPRYTQAGGPGVGSRP